MSKNLLWLSCATGALVLGVGAAHAATATATAEATAEAGGTVAELVVVAEHRETALQKIPVAVSVFNGAERDLVGINTVSDVTNFAPGFSYDPTTVHAYIRGVGRQSINVTDDQRVSTYEDEFIVYSPYGLDKSSLFLAQEQIERGPQNVGGRAAAAGSIDMIRVRPTDHPYLEVRGTAASFQYYDFELAASDQVAPGLTARIAGYYHVQDQGYFKNLVTGVSEGDANKEWYVEAQTDWKPNDRNELWLRASDEGWDNRGDAGARNFFNSGSWDETKLTDSNFGSALFYNANFGYSAPNGNPTANAALTQAQKPVAMGGLGDKDPTPVSVSLFQPSILNSPAMINPHDFAAWRARTVSLDKYVDFNGIFTHKWDTFEFKYVGGIQGYNYSLFLPSVDSNVASFVLPGSSANGATIFALNNGFGGGAFPGCASCGAGGKPLPAATPLPAASTLTLVPQGISDYIENDVWTGHDFFFESTDNSRFQWTVGGFFYYQHYDQPQEARYPGQPQLSQPFASLPSAITTPGPNCGPLHFCGFTGGTLAAPNPDDLFAFFEYNFKVMSEAAYGQFSYKFNDQFKFTGNIRYSNDRKWGDEKARFVAFNSGIIDGLSGFFGQATPSLDFTLGLACLTGNNSGANAAQQAASCASGPLAKGVKTAGVLGADGFVRRHLDDSSGATTGGAGVEWTPTNDIFVYARYGRGYESISFSVGSVVANPEVAPEFLNSYEIGYKQTIGHGLSYDIAAFYYDYLNIQVPISFIGNGGVVQAAFVNVPKSVSDGIELEGVWAPIKPLRLSLSYSYDHTAILTKCFGTVTAGVFTKDPSAFCLLDTNDTAAVQPGANPVAGGGGVQGVNGNPLPNAPANKVAFSGAYTWEFDPGALTFEASYSWRDQQFSNLFARFYNRAPAWDDVDMRLTWRGKGDRYEVIGYVKNLFNTLQYPVGTTGAQYAGTASSIGLTETQNFQLNPPRTFGVEARYKFF